MAPLARRRSVDSSSDHDKGSKKSFFRIGRKKKHDNQDHLSSAGQTQQPQNLPQSFPQFPIPMVRPFGFQDSFDDDRSQTKGNRDPPAYSPPAPAGPPPSGYRVPLSTTSAFPPQQQAGQPTCFDADGRSPIFIGSALLQNSVHPCKVAPHLSPPCRVPYGGTEYEHHGRYDLLPFLPESMEWVRTSNGQIPPGRRPVEGGYEDHGAKLYHALAVVNGVKVPGKTGEHLGGCNVAFGGGENVITRGYEILCWK